MTHHHLLGHRRRDGWRGGWCTCGRWESEWYLVRAALRQAHLAHVRAACAVPDPSMAAVGVAKPNP